MNLQDELLAQDYSIGIYDPEFDGEQFEYLTFYKQIDTDNFLIDLNVDVCFRFGEGGCEVDSVNIAEITVADEDNNEEDISNDLYKLIKESITTYYE